MVNNSNRCISLKIFIYTNAYLYHYLLQYLSITSYRSGAISTHVYITIHILFLIRVIANIEFMLINRREINCALLFLFLKQNIQCQLLHKVAFSSLFESWIITRAWSIYSFRLWWLFQTATLFGNTSWWELVK